MRAQITSDRYLVTCEHGGNRIPAAYRSLFRGHGALLRSHRGYDPGALLMARMLARRLRAPLVAATVSRLLVDLNRSATSRGAFSSITRAVAPSARQRILERYYEPYRRLAEERVRHAVHAGHRLIHLSSHSFTPRMNGRVRKADIGLLYDPARSGERELCTRWQRLLVQRAPRLSVRRNYPYLGKSDGLASFFRGRYPPHQYIGVEIELNQRHCRKPASEWATLRGIVIESLCEALLGMGTA